MRLPPLVAPVTLCATMRINCPICRREQEVPTDFAYRPFCSRRCKMIDLGNWLDEVYRLSRPLQPDDLAAPGEGE
jgi:hypothetical protein